MHPLQIINRDLCKILITNEKDQSNLKILSTYISKTYDLKQEKIQQVEVKLSHYFLPTFEKEWKESFCKIENFEKKNKK